MIRANQRHTVGALLAISVATLFLLLWEDDSSQKSYFHNQGHVFGTYYNIRYEANTDLQDSIQAALQAFDNSLSMFNPRSVLSAVNANRDTMTDAAFEHMWAEAEQIYRLSDGAFDITVAPLVNAYGFGNKSNPLAAISIQTIDSLLQFVGFDKVQLMDHRVVKSDSRVMIDAGAVAKGQSCDMIGDMLRRNGCENYLVDIGGEVVCHGVNDKGQPWHVGITRPNVNNEGAQESLQEILALRDACMATSGNYRNYYYEGQERRSHTIDPRSGRPVQHSLLSATVVSSTCMRADALATACMVIGAEKALELMDRAGDAACYLIVAQNDSLVAISSPNWTKMITK